MKKTKKRPTKSNWLKNSKQSAQRNSMVYGLGVIGAAVYYIQVSTSFWMGAWGIIKAFLWPAFGIYELFKFLGM